MKDEHAIVRQVTIAQTDSKKADALIRQYLPFIKSETAKFMKRAPVEGQDEELSIAMVAFYESMMAYDKKKGAFLSLASLTIRNRLIDYYRKEKRHYNITSLETPVAQDGEGGEGTLMDQLADERDHIEDKVSIQAARQEIEKFTGELALFDLNLTDIADACPKQERTLEACLGLLEHAKQNPDIFDELLANKKLPVTRLAKETGVAKKTIERHRKYIIGIFLAFTNGFEIIRGHLTQLKGKEVDW